MTRRAVMIQGALALAGLVAAYTTWQRQPELVGGEVFVLDITRNDLEKVRFEDQEVKSWAELARDKDEGGTFVTLRLSGHDASGVALPSGHPGVALKVPERLVRGNENARRVFESFAPLRASRALGVLDPARLKELGLDTTKKWIEVTARGNKRRFAIVPAPPGGNDPYLRDEQDGRVYIVARHILSDLQSASVNLVERRFHPFRLEEVERIVVTGASGKKKEYKTARVDENLPGIRLLPASAPDKPDETAKNWHDRIWNLFPATVLGKGEAPATNQEAQGVLRVEYFSRGKPLGWLELAKTKPAAGQSATGAAPREVSVARSEFTLGWMQLSADAGALITEGETLVSR